jgi:hypothetical protein
MLVLRNMTTLKKVKLETVKFSKKLAFAKLRRWLEIRSSHLFMQKAAF